MSKNIKKIKTSIPMSFAMAILFQSTPIEVFAEKLPNETIEDITLNNHSDNVKNDTENTLKDINNTKINNHKDIVDIPDVNFKKELNRHLNQPLDADITTNQMQSIKSFVAENKKITSIQGIEACENLTSLNLNNNNIKDIEPLKNLTKLETLRLNKNSITNINPLIKITNLKNLDLGINKIDDIKPLSNLVNLNMLELGLNKIKDINPLSTLKNLETLRIMNNQIVDLKPISELTNLNFLNLESNQITDLKPISELTNLNFLKLGMNRIINIKPLSKLNKLSTLDLKRNNIINISSLESLSKLTNLNISEQKHILKSVKVGEGKNLSIPNPIIDTDGFVLNINNISDKGSFNDFKNSIDWKNIAESKDLTFEFNKTVNIGKTNGVFSGIVTQPVTINSLPTISGADDISIREGDAFNSMDGISANDKEDGNITQDIKVTGTVNTDKPGKYELIYTVTDKNGDTTTVKRVVTVNPKMVAINNPPTIKAEDKTIKIGDKFNPMIGVTATDTEDGDITKDIKVIEDTVDTSKVGIYKVVYKVIDSKGAISTKTITVTVRSNDKPTISGVDNVSIKEGTTFSLMDGVTATDTEDGNITKDIKVTGTVDINKPGKYELTYTVTDTDGNTTTVKRIVTVNPKIVAINNPPTIKAEDKTIKVGDKFNPRTDVTAIDKEDGNITKDIKVVENTVDTSKPGIYKVTYKVTDSQGATFTKTIIVKIEYNINNTINNTDKPQTGDSELLISLTLGISSLIVLLFSKKNKNI